MHGLGDTVAAIATGSGSAALGIVRVSGLKAAEVVEAVVSGSRLAARPRRVVAGVARCPRTDELLDEVLCFYCPGPRTATGEDSAELHGHGGLLVMERLLRALLDAGAEPAEPGEFTYRAFRNGRLDLSQAEAVMGLIGARSQRAANVALRHLRGELGLSLDCELRKLTSIAAQVEVGLDFPDEDIPPARGEELAHKLRSVAARLTVVRDSFELGKRLSRGARVAIVGPPNAGKSSLLNRMVGEKRAIVDHEPGTTRDMVEAHVELGGIQVTFQDTAGVRAEAGRVERQGMEKTIDAAEAADLVLLVVDGASGAENEIGTLLRSVPNAIDKMLLALNKVDLPGWRDRVDSRLFGVKRVPISALTGEGMEDLARKVGEKLSFAGEDDTVVLTTARQNMAVEASLAHVTRAAEALVRGDDPELSAEDLRRAVHQLASLWGRSAADDVLDEIFSTFCIGK